MKIVDSVSVIDWILDNSLFVIVIIIIITTLDGLSALTGRCLLSSPSVAQQVLKSVVYYENLHAFYTLPVIHLHNIAVFYNVIIDDGNVKCKWMLISDTARVD